MSSNSTGVPPALQFTAEEERAAKAPVLIIGVGNPSRGDDGLGPKVIASLQARQDRGDLPGIELLTDFQLQLEHLLDLCGRERVIVVDAAVALEAPYRFRAVAPSPSPNSAVDWTSHRLTPSALLGLYRVLYGAPPALDLLAIRASSFELGSGLSARASRDLVLALERLMLELEGRTAPARQA
jgi:hydrogenase maturation protease